MPFVFSSSMFHANALSCRHARQFTHVIELRGKIKRREETNFCEDGRNGELLGYRGCSWLKSLQHLFPWRMHGQIIRGHAVRYGRNNEGFNLIGIERVDSNLREISPQLLATYWVPIFSIHTNNRRAHSLNILKSCKQFIKWLMVHIVPNSSNPPDRAADQLARGFFASDACKKANFDCKMEDSLLAWMSVQWWTTEYHMMM